MNTPIERLGLAITAAGYTWSGDMRLAWEQANAMIDRQQSTMRYALAAWDSTVLDVVRDGRMQEAMETVRAEIAGTESSNAMSTLK